MSYVVFEKSTTKIIGSRSTSYFKTVAAAKAHLTRMVKMGYRRSDFAIAESSNFFEVIEKKVTRTNLMTGKEYQESVNTPNCCSPASETYWSM